MYSRISLLELWPLGLAPGLDSVAVVDWWYFSLFGTVLERVNYIVDLFACEFLCCLMNGIAWVLIPAKDLLPVAGIGMSCLTVWYGYEVSVPSVLHNSDTRVLVRLSFVLGRCRHL